MTACNMEDVLLDDDPDDADALHSNANSDKLHLANSGALSSGASSLSSSLSSSIATGKVNSPKSRRNFATEVLGGLRKAAASPFAHHQEATITEDSTAGQNGRRAFAVGNCNPGLEAEDSEENACYADEESESGLSSSSNNSSLSRLPITGDHSQQQRRSSAASNCAKLDTEAAASANPFKAHNSSILAALRQDTLPSGEHSWPRMHLNRTGGGYDGQCAPSSVTIGSGDLFLSPLAEGRLTPPMDATTTLPSHFHSTPRLSETAPTKSQALSPASFEREEMEVNPAPTKRFSIGAGAMQHVRKLLHPNSALDKDLSVSYRQNLAASPGTANGSDLEPDIIFNDAEQEQLPYHFSNSRIRASSTPTPPQEGFSSFTNSFVAGRGHHQSADSLDAKQALDEYYDPSLDISPNNGTALPPIDFLGAKICHPTTLWNNVSRSFQRIGALRPSKSDPDLERSWTPTLRVTESMDRLRVRCAPALANIKTFVAVICFLITVHGALSAGYLMSVVTTIEKRFDLPSRVSGLIVSSYEIGSLLSVLFVSYFGSQRHIPRWIGIGALLLAVGSFIFALPQFLAPAYIVEPYFGKGVGGGGEAKLVIPHAEPLTGDQPDAAAGSRLTGSGENNGSMWTMLDANKTLNSRENLTVTVRRIDMCHSTSSMLRGGVMKEPEEAPRTPKKDKSDILRRSVGSENDKQSHRTIPPPKGPLLLLDDEDANNATTANCDSSQRSNSGASDLVFLFIIAQIMIGIGGSPIFTLGTAYIDNHVKKEDSAMYLAAMYVTVAFGPVCGFLLGSQMINLYVDAGVDTPPGLNAGSAAWVGRWWAGFIICATFYLISALPFFAFPRQLDTSSTETMSRSDTFPTSLYDAQRNRKQSAPPVMTAKLSNLPPLPEKFRQAAALNWPTNQAPPPKPPPPMIGQSQIALTSGDSQSYLGSMTSIASSNASSVPTQAQRTQLTQFLTKHNLQQRSQLSCCPQQPKLSSQSNGATTCSPPAIPSPPNSWRPESRVSMAPSEASSTCSTTTSYAKSLKNIPCSVLRLLSNWVYMIASLGACVNLCIVSGFSVFLPKYLETQFRVSPSQASLLTGSVAIPGAIFGIGLGGWVLKRYKLELNGSSTIVVLSNILTMILFVLFFFFGCDNLRVAGATSSYETPMSLLLDQTSSVVNVTDPCNSGCSCSLSDIEMVCGSNGLTYLSPCFAGCTEISHTKLASDSKAVQLNFGSCSCVPKSSEGVQIAPIRVDAIEGPCVSNCAMLIPFLALLFILTFVASTTQMPLVMITLRSVAEEEKAFALGLQVLMFRIFCYIPAPILYGWVIDTTCLVKREVCGTVGGCLLYNIESFRLKYAAVSMVLKLVGTLLSALLWWCIRKHYVPFSAPITMSEIAHRLGSAENLHITRCPTHGMRRHLSDDSLYSRPKSPRRHIKTRSC